MKTSLAPGSKVVTDYLRAAGLTQYLEKLDFNLVGYGCTTCIGNSGPLPEAIGAAIKENSLVAVSVLSGNRNFEGRIHPLVRANYLASPPLVVAYALAGRMDFDMATDSLGNDQQRQAGLSARHLADAAGSGRDGARSRHHRDVPQGVRRSLRGRRALARPESAGGRSLRLGRQVHLHQAPAILREDAENSARSSPTFTMRACWRCSGNSVTTDHISPAGLDQRRRPRGQISDRQGREAARNSTPTARAAAITK